MKKLLYIVIFFLSISCFGQNYDFRWYPEGQRTCLTSTTVNLETPSVTVNLLDYADNTSHTTDIYRRAYGDTIWTSVVSDLSAGTVSWTDTNVSVGETWEYKVERPDTWYYSTYDSTYNAIGYTSATLLRDNTGYQGQMILLVASDVATSLTTKVNRLKQELAVDGWLVHSLVITKATSWSPTSDVITIRGQVQDIYNAAPENDKPKLLFILGHIPMPRSGIGDLPAPDGHTSNKGARGCDAYYADINGVWTDDSTYDGVTDGVHYSVQTNYPNDYRWDQSQIPSDVEMMFGRVDFEDIILSPYTEMELYERYLDKLSSYKNVYSGWDMGQRSAYHLSYMYRTNESTWRSLPNISGSENVYEEPYTTLYEEPNYPQWVSENGPFIMYMQNQTVPDTTEWNDYGMNAAIYTGCQSHFGYPDVPMESGYDWGLIRTLLAGFDNTKNVVNIYTTTSLNLFHRAAVGLSIGEALKPVMNLNYSNKYETLEKPEQAQDDRRYWGRSYFSIVGDPTVRLYQVAPVTNESLTQVSNLGRFSWTASTSPVIGYNVYKADSLYGKYEKLNSSLITSTSYDYNPIIEGDYYLIKAVEQDTSGSGIFLISSLGTPIEATFSVSDTTPAYYISYSEGSDSNDGRSAATPWQTFTNLNSLALLPGDSVLLKRGDVWRSSITLNESGEEGVENYIHIGAYGTGNKPKILGSTKVPSWTAQGTTNIWTASGSYTNSSDYRIWFMENDTAIWGDYETYSSDFANLTEKYDYTYNGTTIYCYSETDPSTAFDSVEVSQRSYCIQISPSNSYIEIKDLELKFTYDKGFFGGYPAAAGATDLIFDGLVVGYIGRPAGANDYGISCFHSNTLVQNCYFSDCGRRAVSINRYASEGTTLCPIRNIIIRDNTFERGLHTTSLDLSVMDRDNDTIIGVYFYNNLVNDAGVDDSYFQRFGDLDITSNGIFFQDGDTDCLFDSIYIVGNSFRDANRWVLFENNHRAWVYNNTFTGTNRSLLAQMHGPFTVGALDSLIMKNNIFYDYRPYNGWNINLCHGYGSPNTGYDRDYNLYFQGNSGSNFNIITIDDAASTHYYYSMSQWSAFMTAWPALEVHSPTPAFPLFTDTTYSDYDLNLLENSPAIGAGVVLPYIIVEDNYGVSDTINKYDMNGIAFSRTSPSIGAYEYSLMEQSSEKNVTAFTIIGQSGSTTINTTNHTVSLNMLYGTDITDLTPTISISAGATILPTSGTSRDFTNPVVYTVTAEDESYQEWTVTIEVEEAPVISNVKVILINGNAIMHNGNCVINLTE